MLATPDVHVNLDSKTVEGRGATINRYKVLRAAFPDMKIDNEYVLVDGDRAAVEYVIEGTQKGPFRTPEGELIQPTGKSVRIRGMDFMQFNPSGQLISLVAVHNQDDFGTQLQN